MFVLFQQDSFLLNENLSVGPETYISFRRLDFLAPVSRARGSYQMEWCW